jgi:predicted ArsR family transcriptional regulator
LSTTNENPMAPSTAEQGQIPPVHRKILLELIADGETSTGVVASTLGVSSWTARTYLESLRAEGILPAETTGAPVTTRDRLDAIRYGRRFASDTENASLVAKNAAPIIEWLESAGNRAELNGRREALREAHAAALLAESRGETVNRDDNPERFLDSACTLHAFIYPHAQTA